MTRKRSGMSLVEVLIGLAIGALMFTAVAMAIHTGSRSTVINQDFFSATQAGRLGMSYMLRTIRGSDPEPAPANADEEANSVNLACEGGTSAVAFSWDPKTLELTVDRDGKLVVLARRVSNFTCRRQSQQASNGSWFYNNYQISMTVTVGDQSIRFSESVVPRRAILR